MERKGGVGVLAGHECPEAQKSSETSALNKETTRILVEAVRLSEFENYSFFRSFRRGIWSSTAAVSSTFCAGAAGA